VKTRKHIHEEIFHAPAETIFKCQKPDRERGLRTQHTASAEAELPSLTVGLLTLPTSALFNSPS